MIRHVSLFTWQPGVTEEQVHQAMAKIATLPPLLRGLRDYRYGPDLGLNEGNADFAIVADLDDEQAYLDYRDHPAHRDIAERVIKPLTRQRVAVQYEI